MESGSVPKHEAVIVNMEALVSQVRKEMHGLVSFGRPEMLSCKTLNLLSGVHSSVPLLQDLANIITLFDSAQCTY